MISPLSIKKPNITREDLPNLINNLETCPLKNSGSRVIYPVGYGSSGIFLIGEAPGAREDKLGEPFVGASGRILNHDLLPTVGLNRQNIYLTNIVKCRPPSNRDPLPEEKQAWSLVLLAELVALHPRLVVCLGRHSLSFFFPKVKISEVHGTISNVKLYEDFNLPVLAMYHPAVALYNRSKISTLISDFAVVKKYVLEPEFK